MKVLVTGANGFLGSHVVKKLIESGYEVKAFILPNTSEEPLNGLSYEVYKGNLLSIEDITKAIDSCDYVIHTAAITDVWPSKNPLSWKINYDAVVNLVDVIKSHPVKKLIHVGTANSFGFGNLSKPGNEESPYTCGKYGLDYMDSKKAAQDFLLSEAKKSDPLLVIIINPTFMIGDNDTKPGPGEMIISVMTRSVPGYAAGGRCFSSVKDVADAIVNAIDKGRIGECYITGGTNLCYHDFFALIGKIAHVDPPKIKIPTWLAIPFAAMIELFAKIQNKKPKISRSMAKISGDGHYYSSEKAKSEIGYHQSDLEQSLSEAITWYINNGYVHKGDNNGKFRR